MYAPLQQLNIEKRKQLEGPLVLLDATDSTSMVDRALQSGFSGILTGFETSTNVGLSDRYLKVVNIDEGSPSEALRKLIADTNIVISSGQVEYLKSQGLKDVPTAYRAYVTDSESLHEAIRIGREHLYLFLRFKDPTNIPLELVIASLQSSKTVLIKEIAQGDVEDAIVTLGVMEMGADGVLFNPSSHENLDQFLKKLAGVGQSRLELSVGEVTSSRPIGMGHRSCIDLATLFTESEGMLVGSTSQGGILCCPEVFYLPYMDLRPFRVNAGAVHSYVYNFNNRTDYMTELRAGSPVMIVDTNGKPRPAFVGRMKTEVRPLRLIEVEFQDNKRVNVLLQDDWHVRVFSDEGKPRNITELKRGDKLLGWVSEPGRHVGIKVSENIVET